VINHRMLGLFLAEAKRVKRNVNRMGTRRFMDGESVPRKRKKGKRHSLLIQFRATPQPNFTGGGVV
ncbi:MAG: hypothetical protein OSB74_12080, partial [Verrucomicrobiota bacterium]|nr:hypothetical protein [Verrucomicrobiota bacterium]